MEQSIQELEKVYERFMEQHQAVLAQTVARKELQTSLSTFINQSRPFLSSIQAGTFFLNQAPDLPKRLRQGVSRIRTTGKQMAKTIQHLQHFQNRETDWPALFKDRNGHPRSGRILFATPFSDEFRIVRHHLTHRIRATLFQAESTDEAMMSVADTRPDLILINHRLNDGSGLHLLEKLVRLGTRAPVIFVVSRNHTDAGAAAVASGAQTFLILEQTTGMDLANTIQHSLAQAKMIHQVQGAMNRIELISRRDQLTLLLNRSGFNQTLAVEMAKASFDETRTPEDSSPTLPELIQQAIHALEHSIQQGGNQIQS